jgi:hypothetical protein
MTGPISLARKTDVDIGHPPQAAWANAVSVIASAAKQSIAPQTAKWIASSLTLLAMTAAASSPRERKALIAGGALGGAIAPLTCEPRRMTEPRRRPSRVAEAVIASAAKQSMAPQAVKWIASSLVLLAMTVSRALLAMKAGGFAFISRSLRV